MSGSASSNWSVFGNSAPVTEQVAQAPDVAVRGTDTNRLRMKGWEPNSPGAYCKSFSNITENEVQKICSSEPTALDYLPAFIQRYP